MDLSMFKKIVLALGILILLIIAYNLVGQIFQTLKSGDRLTQASEKLHQLELKNTRLKKRLSEVNSPDFIEEEARNKLGLSKEGETLIIIPDEKLNQILEASREAKMIKFPNWLGWWKVFF